MTTKLSDLKMMGPLIEDHPLITDGDVCPACKKPFKHKDYVTLIALGPGGNIESRQKAREGRAYNAIAQPVHWACATGYECEHTDIMNHEQF